EPPHPDGRGGSLLSRLAEVDLTAGAVSACRLAPSVTEASRFGPSLKPPRTGRGGQLTAAERRPLLHRAAVPGERTPPRPEPLPQDSVSRAARHAGPAAPRCAPRSPPTDGRIPAARCCRRASGPRAARARARRRAFLPDRRAGPAARTAC